jgi:hypothetical protein
MLVASAATIMRLSFELALKHRRQRYQSFRRPRTSETRLRGSLLWGTASTIIQRNDTPMRWFLRHTMLQE